MDVQAAAATPVTLPPGFAQLAAAQPSSLSSAASAVAATVAASSGAVTPASGSDAGSSNAKDGSSSQAGASNTNGNPLIGPTPGLATLPAAAPGGTKPGAAADATLTNGVAKLFNTQEQNISVSFQIEQNPNEIVTVFTDKQTGKVIVQFPSETLIALAKFFDKLDGNVVNKKV
jgi:flagellar protein FlaG